MALRLLPLMLRATSFLSCAVMCSRAARADRNDGIVQDPEHFAKTAAHSQQIKAAVDRVQEKTQAAKEAAMAVKTHFGEYQGTISDLKGQLESVDQATHSFEGELWDHLAGEETSRLEPFEEISSQFDLGEQEANASQEDAWEFLTSTSHEADSEASLLQSSHGPEDAAPQQMVWQQASSMLQVGGEGEASRWPSLGKKKEAEKGKGDGDGRFAKSAEHSSQIKAAVGKVKEKVESAKTAAAKVQTEFGEYRGKVTDLKDKLSEVDKQQHAYHDQLLDHFQGQEEGRMGAFDEVKPGMLGGEEEAKGSNETGSQ